MAAKACYICIEEESMHESAVEECIECCGAVCEEHYTECSKCEAIVCFECKEVHEEDCED